MTGTKPTIEASRKSWKGPGGELEKSSELGMEGQERRVTVVEEAAEECSLQASVSQGCTRHTARNRNRWFPKKGKGLPRVEV